ncbi:MAG: hypothetical protein IJV44_08790 [Prevotella sp.]|nr:hypothetical protein [Prevotella sp.]
MIMKDFSLLYIALIYLAAPLFLCSCKTKQQLTNEARVEGKFTCTMPCKEEEDERQIETPMPIQHEYTPEHSPLRTIT